MQPAGFCHAGATGSLPDTPSEMPLRYSAGGRPYRTHIAPLPARHAVGPAGAQPPEAACDYQNTTRSRRLERTALGRFTFADRPGFHPYGEGFTASFRSWLRPLRPLLFRAGESISRDSPITPRPGDVLRRGQEARLDRLCYLKASPGSLVLGDLRETAAIQD